MTTEPRIYSWYNEERRVSSVNAGGITGQPHAHAKINSKWVNDLHEDTKTIKLLGNNTGGQLLDTSHGDAFLDLTPKQSNRSMGYITLKSFYKAKENHQENEKVTYWTVENICKSCTW